MNDFVTCTKLPNNVGYLGKIIIAISFEWLPKVQKIAQSGHTDHSYTSLKYVYDIGSNLHLMVSVEDRRTDDDGVPDV